LHFDLARCQRCRARLGWSGESIELAARHRLALIERGNLGLDLGIGGEVALPIDATVLEYSSMFASVTLRQKFRPWRARSGKIRGRYPRSRDPSGGKRVRNSDMRVR